MFEITHQELRDQSFVTGMRKVLNHPIKDFKVSYNLGRMGTQLTQLQKEADTSFQKLVKAHGSNNDNDTFEIPDDKLEGWKKAHEDFLAHSIKVERHKIRIEDVEGVALTPSEIVSMGPVLDGLDGLDN